METNNTNINMEETVQEVKNANGIGEKVVVIGVAAGGYVLGKGVEVLSKKVIKPGISKVLSKFKKKDTDIEVEIEKTEEETEEK